MCTLGMGKPVRVWVMPGSANPAQSLRTPNLALNSIEIYGSHILLCFLAIFKANRQAILEKCVQGAGHCHGGHVPMQNLS